MFHPPKFMMTIFSPSLQNRIFFAVSSVTLSRIWRL